MNTVRQPSRPVGAKRANLDPLSSPNVALVKIANVAGGAVDQPQPRLAVAVRFAARRAGGEHDPLSVGRPGGIRVDVPARLGQQHLRSAQIRAVERRGSPVRHRAPTACIVGLPLPTKHEWPPARFRPATRRESRCALQKRGLAPADPRTGVSAVHADAASRLVPGDHVRRRRDCTAGANALRVSGAFLAARCGCSSLSVLASVRLPA